MVICNYVCIYMEAMPGLILLSKMVRNWIPFPHQLNLLNFLLPAAVRGKLCFFFVDYNIEKWSNIKKFMIANNIKVWQVSGIWAFLVSTIEKPGPFEVFESFKDFVTGIDCKTLSTSSEHTLENSFPVPSDHFKWWCDCQNPFGAQGNFLDPTYLFRTILLSVLDSVVHISIVWV